MALNIQTLLVRTLTAAVFVAVLVSSILYNYLTFFGLFLIISIWGLIEFYKICEKLNSKPSLIVGLIVATLFLGSVFLQNTNPKLINTGLLDSLPFLFIPSVFLIAIFSKQEAPIKNAVFTIAGIAYCILPFYYLNKMACIDFSLNHNHSLNEFHYTPQLILGLFFLIWANDTYAYLVGSLIGKHKLLERISPGKTWEGTIGAAILTLGSTYFISNWFTILTLFEWIVIALIVVIIGTLGDLAESLLKRQARIKDSGKIMPGHGGVLDRFDSLMFITPFVYFYLIVCK